MRPNLALIAAAAAAVPIAFLVSTAREGAPEQETVASLDVSPTETKPVETSRVQIEPGVDPDSAALAPIDERVDEAMEMAAPESSAQETVAPAPVEVVTPQPVEPQPVEPDPAALAETRAAEEAATLALRSIAAAQRAVQVSGAIDTNGDLVGEFGFLAELAGTAPVRTHGDRGPRHGQPGEVLEPPILAAHFGDLRPTSQGGACEIDGYLFSVHLSGARRVNGRVEAVSEATNGGASDLLPDGGQGALRWCAYAWPVADSSPARRAFFIDASGTVLGMSNDDTAARRYVGYTRVPRWSAAYAEKDMAGALGESGAFDGNVWTR